MKYFIAYDLGTGGIKASLHRQDVSPMAYAFAEYPTYYPQPHFQEQRPEDWWAAVCGATKELLGRTGVAAQDIACLALSGQSLVALPLDGQNQPLLDQVPIWSDTRAGEEADLFFRQVDQKEWYLATGNGFPPACYSLFKMMWLRRNRPDIYEKTRWFIGSKDYINLRLTGAVCTDFSYASGTGAYHLKEARMWPAFLAAAGIDADRFPPVVSSHNAVGTVTPEAARQTGLLQGTPVACGAVDNACMALGAVGVKEGAVYVSLGSSSWIPVNSSEPVLDAGKKPYVFAHVEEGMFTSAFSIFAGGSSLRWARDMLCADFAGQSDAYDRIAALAANSPVGANGVLFNPSLAGGTSQDASVNIRGAFLNLHLGARREDLLRAVMEGIALNLRTSLLYLKEHTPLDRHILICGGGARSPFWMQMFADVFGMEVLTTNVDQDAASLGAAAIAARAAGLWPDYTGIRGLHQVKQTFAPDAARHAEYRKLHEIFMQACGMLADWGDRMEHKQQKGTTP